MIKPPRARRQKAQDRKLKTERERERERERGGKGRGSGRGKGKKQCQRHRDETRGNERERKRKRERERPRKRRDRTQGRRGYREWRGDPIIPRRCHEIASELYSIRVARPIARPSRTLEETLLHFGLSRLGLKLSLSLSLSVSLCLSSLLHDRRQSVTVLEQRRCEPIQLKRIVLSIESSLPLNSETCTPSSINKNRL